MIPAGVFNQTSGPGILGFLNINGSYWENVRPSTRTWPEDYPEAEAMYSTTNNTTSGVTGAYAPYLQLKPGLGAAFDLFLNRSGTITILNAPNTSNDRISRSLRVANVSSWVEIFMKSLPVGTKYKLHFFGSATVASSLRLTISSDGNPTEILSKASVSSNPFVLTPYEPGGDESWLSTEIRTMTESYVSILFESVTGVGILTAICVEIL